MRPRSRLLSKRRLQLPTIREGTEETVRDMNQANTLHSSAQSQALSEEDYLLSICHLAHPTFPIQDASSDDITSCQLGSPHARVWPPRHSSGTSTTFELRHGDEARLVGELRGERQDLNGEHLLGCHGNSDPLEYLYGHRSYSALYTVQSGSEKRGLAEGKVMRRCGEVREEQSRSRAHSVPRASSPSLPHQHKSSCPELHVSTLSLKHASARSQARSRSPPDTDTVGKRQGPTAKPSLISQWISDCKSAWREARVRACMLPAIAEI